jgi:BirA family biotin operon repressor/biotin-[acetyl-CoA-carboxylase] ligase
VAFRLIELDEINSTNAEALRRAAAGERGPLWIMARRQTHGRGRSGRTWQDGPGNLMATLLFEPGCPPTALHHLSLLTGVAAVDAVAPFMAQRPSPLRLKWPNDILLGGAKLGGILVESSIFAGTTLAAIGIGINLADAPAVPGRPTASLARAAAARPSPQDVLSALDARLAHWRTIWAAGAHFDTICSAWLERAGPIGEPITVHAASGIVTGTFAGLAPDGALLVQERNGTVTRVTAGDVILSATNG